MALVENKLLLALVGLAVVYIAYRLLFAADRTDKLYQETMESILNSEEYKVKGRFE